MRSLSVKGFIRACLTPSPIAKPLSACFALYYCMQYHPLPVPAGISNAYKISYPRTRFFF